MTAAQDQLDLLRLARTETVGPVNFRKLLRRFGTAAAALEALPGLWRDSGRDRIPALCSTTQANREMAHLATLGGTWLFLGQPDYPNTLASLDDAPPVLAVLGDVAVLYGRAVAVVGGRNASSNGRRMAELLAADMATAGLCVVSGMARGVDGAAHEGALRAGRTVAAVAGGLDHPYPPEHAGLQARIADTGGCVVSEVPLGTVPRDRHFPRRNRIIAGLALGVVVVEAAPRSGSLITATMALDAGRELFAVPGSPLDPRCRGSNDLIRQGAHLVESAADVLAHLPDALPTQVAPALPLFTPRRSHAPAAPAAAPPVAGESGLDQLRPQVIRQLGPSPTAVDDLVRHCQVPAAAVMAVLLELELAGRIETLPGNRVCLLAAD